MKMRAGYSIFILLVSLTLFGIVDVCIAGKLSYKFYKRTCPRAEQIVKEIIQNRTQSNPSLGARLIRMQFHDCFVRGCDASVLLDTVNNSTAEKEAIPNSSLSGFDVIDDIKTAIERVCPKVVSCADILALAARDAVSAPVNNPLLATPFHHQQVFRLIYSFEILLLQFSKPLWDVQLGRRDGMVSLATETNGNLPSPFANFTSLIQLFNRKGLDVNDLVVLSGAHTIGVAHCATFSSRLYNFTGKGDADPSLDPTYAEALRKQCPNPASPTITVEMDPKSSLSFDNHYYDILLQKKGLFVSDAALLTNRNSNKIVTRLQRSRSSFFPAFAKSVKKMGAIEVLTGNAGEIRQNCRVVNP
ncbi:peroxidase 27-like [Gossypium australe]|uniref:Peroxidase n=1 Tax=Gossypium australe TaxID=47621 RepID=A0A5B6WGI4_9ROSI|nr:peroxidase 27-like [Gossypium australe]